MPNVGGAWVPATVDEENAPDDTFPGITAAFTDAAFPGGHQPAVLEAWPVNATTTIIKPCWKASVLESTATGWPGECSGLNQISNTPAIAGSLANATAPITQGQCETICSLDPRCSVWQFNTDNSTIPFTTSCWTGQGRHCYQASSHGGTPDTISVTIAQRLQHGDVRVLRNMQNVEVLNLYQLGDFQTGMTSGVAAERCRNWCYSSVTCTYWQFGADGCRVEFPNGNTAAAGAPSNTVAMFPLLTTGIAQNNSVTTGLIAGEYIQHYCPPAPPPAPGSPGAAPAAPGSCTDGFNLPVLGCVGALQLGLGVLAAVLVAGLVWFFCCRKPSKKSKSSKDADPKKSNQRSVQRQANKEAAKAPEPPAAPAAAPPPSDMRAVAPTPSQEPLLPQYQPPPAGSAAVAPAQQPYRFQTPQYAQPSFAAQTPQYAQQSFAVPNNMPNQQVSFSAQPYQYAQVAQNDPSLLSRVNLQQGPSAAVPAMSAAAAAVLPPEAAQFQVGDRVHVWSRNNNTWHPDGQVAAIDAQGWHVRYDQNQTQKVVLFADGQNLQKY